MLIYFNFYKLILTCCDYDLKEEKPLITYKQLATINTIQLQWTFSISYKRILEYSAKTCESLLTKKP